MKNCLSILLSFLAGQALANPIVIDYNPLTHGLRSSSSTQSSVFSSTLSTSSASSGGATALRGNHDSGYRTVGVNAFGGTDSSYGNGNRYLSTSGYHLVGEQHNKVSKRTVKCPTCEGEGIVRNWWGGRETCENCKGEGLSVKCSNCNSTGRVWRWWGWKTDCPECRGK